jgi:hypothetical protein
MQLMGRHIGVFLNKTASYIKLIYSVADIGKHKRGEK